MSRTFAYCRVSTSDQTPENQVREIEAAGFWVERHRIVAETVSGGIPASARSGFAKLLDRLEPGDVLVVTKLDRLGRNVIDVRQTVEAVAQRGVRVHCLALGGVDLTAPAGKMTMSVIGAVAEFERDLLIERTQAGLARARAEGKQPGRPSRLSKIQKQQIVARLAAGSSIYGLAKEFGVDRRVIQRARAVAYSEQQSSVVRPISD
ncbi:recombinase family protein [Methylosinus sp. H3A]|uniref:recombinase family protein n=1 Tax=Methylosinus sp. H3A TaxID=2785786 RepID=UPI0018C21AAF|nr:recombinase family protein [Methylosinus sp. H3A]MBG0810804.1 recombinase family protein [Methylosinus sp. H3A]